MYNKFQFDSKGKWGAGLPNQYHPIAIWLPRLLSSSNSEQVTKIVWSNVIGYCYIKFIFVFKRT